MLNFTVIHCIAVCVNILAGSAMLLWFYIIEQLQENQMKLNFM